MSVDKTISDMSFTLEQLSTLVTHINSKVNGITSRLNLTLDNFDAAIAGIARDANAMTTSVGHTVSQVPNSWVYYLLLITLILVFILLSILLIINLITKCHSFYQYMMATNRNSTIDQQQSTNVTSVYDSKSSILPILSHPPHRKQQHQVSIPIENGRNANTTQRSTDSSVLTSSNDLAHQYAQLRRNNNTSGMHHRQLPAPINRHASARVEAV